MAYTKNTWATGDIITADKLNNLESGLDNTNSRQATFTDFATVASDMNTYAGNWFTKATAPVANSPYKNAYGVVEVIPGDAKPSGLIIFTPYYPSNGYIYYNLVSANGLGTWFTTAIDSAVVHNTGTETVAGNKAFTGDNTFTEQINGSLKTRPARFTDFNTVAANMIQYSGFWRVGKETANAPKPGMLSYLVEVITSSTNASGVILISDYSTNVLYTTAVFNNTLLGWIKIADDSNVFHNSGTETATGDKTFNGQTTMLTGNYGLRVTTAGVQKTSDGGTTWTNI